MDKVLGFLDNENQTSLDSTKEIFDLDLYFPLEPIQKGFFFEAERIFLPQEIKFGKIFSIWNRGSLVGQFSVPFPFDRL